MLISENEIRIDLLYMGPGRGCREVLRCDAIGFRADLDCDRKHESRREAVAELQAALFRKFRTGEYRFDPPEKQAAAEHLIGLSHADLIEKMYDQDFFRRELVKQELIQRNLMDEDIYRIGLFGNDLAVEQAIELMKHKAENGG